MEWIEVTGPTLDAAIERALDSLGVHETELDYEVLAEAKTSLFGLRRTDARIRARVKPRSREKPNDKRRRQRDEARGRRRGGRDRGGESRGSSAAPPRSGARAAERAPRDAESEASGAGAPAAAEARRATTGEAGGSTSGRRRRRRGSGGGAGRESAPDARDAPSKDNETARAAAPSRAREAAAAAEISDDEEHEVMERSGSIEEQIEAGREFATGLLEAFDAQGSVSVDEADHEIEVRVDGDNLGLLVGPKGATLAAIEELLRGAVGHRGPGRMHLDVAGYRAKRKAALADFARRVADDVRSSGSAKALEPMPAPDRKVVHDTVSEIPGVATISDGEEPRRRVIIQPA